MNNPLEAVKYFNFEIHVFNDDLCESPRQNDNLGKIFALHSRFNFTDQDVSVSHDDCGSWEDVRDAIIEQYGDCIILPVYLYHHSGITINTTGFSCPWDSSQVGYIFVEKNLVREQYGVKRISAKLISSVEDVLKSEIKEYSEYLEGACYRYEILDSEENIVDSCGGYIGDIKHCLNDAKAMVDSYVQQAA